MNSDDVERLKRIFSPTSAFSDLPEVELPPAPHQVTASSVKEDCKQIARLLDDAIDCIEDEKGIEALGPIEVAQELARKHA